LPAVGPSPALRVNVLIENSPEMPPWELLRNRSTHRFAGEDPSSHGRARMF